MGCWSVTATRAVARAPVYAVALRRTGRAELNLLARSARSRGLAAYAATQLQERRADRNTVALFACLELGYAAVFLLGSS